MTTIALIYWIIGSLWAIGLHVWAEKKYQYFSTQTTKQKITRGIVGYLFNSALWPFMIPNIIYRYKKGLPFSVTHFL